MNRQTFQKLSSLRQEEAAALIRAGEYPGAYYLAGYAIECALKACVAKQVKRYDFPDRKFVNDAYTHNLESLLKLAGVAIDLATDMAVNGALALNWTIVKDWTEGSRYRLGITENEARDLYSAGTARKNGRAALDSGAMVETNLTSEQINSGAALINRLEEHGIALDAAFWLYFPEDRRWKLVLVEFKRRTSGPRAAYAQVQSVLAKHASELSGISLDDVVLERPDTRIVELIRKAIRTGHGISGTRFRKNVVDGTLIEDAYIYRVA